MKKEIININTVLWLVAEMRPAVTTQIFLLSVLYIIADIFGAESDFSCSYFE